jgi:TonB-linked SusC/RagA family outer membrane protein
MNLKVHYYWLPRPIISKQTLKIMKLVAIILFAACMQVSARGYSQITLSENNAPLQKVFKKIQKQSGYDFLCTYEILKEAGKVTINVRDVSLQKALEECLKGKPLTYVIIGKTIVVQTKEKDYHTVSADLVALEPLPPPPVEIHGRIVNQQGQPLQNVSVLISGTKIGTTTNNDGRFTLTAPDDKNVVLEISSVGYQSKKISVGKQTEINVTLELEVSGLSDVVVIGYGTQKKRDISSAISSVFAKDLQDKPVSNFAQAISGKMAGVRILNSNNAPGGGTNIVIRGINSINASNDPLIVIDGFPLKDGFDKTENPLNAINTADIESIEVLKDASSSAIYGARASNGVILITTKKGKLGKPEISLNINSGFEKMTNKMHMLNREDFLKYMDDARAQAYIVEDPNFGTNNPDLPQWKWTDSDETRIYNWSHFSSNAPFMGQGGTYYDHWIWVTPETKAQPYDNDWQDLTTKVGNVQDIQLSTRGGTDNIKYMISGGYFNQGGIVKSTGYNRYSFRANLEIKINDWLKTGLLLAPSIENLDVMYNLEGAFYDIVTIPPIYRAYDDNGNPEFLGYIPGDYREWNLPAYSNPLANDLVQDNRRTFRNLSTLFAEINLTKGLTFRSEFHTELRNWERNYFIPSSFPDAWSTTRSMGLNNITSRLYWNSQSFLTYNRTFDKHSFNAILGYSAEESSDRSTYISKYDYPTDRVPTLNQAITVLNAQSDARTNRSSETMIGSFARVMYNYNSKYYLTASVRRDGSSKFGENKKWGVFPSFSAAWRVSDESFFSSIKQYINDLKIRAGWGTIGNSGIGNYNSLSTLNATAYVLGTGSTLSPGYVDGRVANSNLGWESSKDFDIGIEADLLGSRISVTVDYFYKLTEDMLFSMPLPTITGFNSYMVNIGSMRNRGFEYMLQTRNIVGNFNWSTNFNLSYYKNRVLNTGKDKRPLIANNSYTVEGKPLAGLWGMDFIGPYKDWEDVKTNPIVNADNPLWRDRSAPGTNKMTDVNGDGVINGLDNTILGSPNPDFIWSMTNNFTYKGIDLSIQINGVQGGDHLMTQMESVMSKGLGYGNVVYSYFNNYWRPDRTDAKYAAPTRKSWDGTSDRGTLVFKGTYVNIQNIVLGYTLPKSIIQKSGLGLKNLRFYASVRNALMITDYPGFNPEVNDSGNSSLSQGIDAGGYPMTRTVSFGLNILL